MSQSHPSPVKGILLVYLIVAKDMLLSYVNLHLCYHWRCLIPESVEYTNVALTTLPSIVEVVFLKSWLLIFSGVFPVHNVQMPLKKKTNLPFYSHALKKMWLVFSVILGVLLFLYSYIHFTNIHKCQLNSQHWFTYFLFSQNSLLHGMTDIQTSNYSKSEMLTSGIMGHKGSISSSHYGFRLAGSDALLGPG